MLNRYIAPEANAGTAHSRVFEVVIQTVNVAPVEVVRFGPRGCCGLARGRGCCIVEVLLPELHAERQQVEQGDGGRKLVPFDVAVYDRECANQSVLGFLRVRRLCGLLPLRLRNGNAERSGGAR